MRFPAWVDGPRKTKAERATARLKYIVNQLAAQNTDRGTVRALALIVGLDHSTISGYIRRGSFSSSAAWTIRRALRQSVPAEYLIDPLNIPATA